MSLSRTLALASALALALAGPVVAPAPALASPSAVHEASTQRAPQPSTENRYAEREKQDPSVGEYEGGNTIVIGISSGTLIVVLLILLLI